MNSSELVRRTMGSTATGLILGILASSQAGLRADGQDAVSSRETGALIISRLGSASYGTYLELYSGNYSRTSPTIEQGIADAYQAFALMQKSLDPEIVAVLERNLWDLYAR